ncbi:MAG: SprT-like domain-containing protein, partial [Prevotella sp.]
MQIDITWLRSNFRQYNKQYFDGRLPEPRFYIGRSKTQLGSLSYKRGLMWSKGLFGKGYDTNAFTLTLSNFYDQTEYQFRNVLLHEMIHLSIVASGVKDTSPHGIVFRGMMQRLNREGWNIQVMTKMEGTKKAYTGSANIIRQYLVLAIEMTNGKRFLSSVNPRFARQINARLKNVSEVSSYHWYTTDNRW